MNGMLRPRPREAGGLNPLMRNKKLGGANSTLGMNAGVVPNRMAQGAGMARKQGLQARAMAARTMKQPGGVA